MTTDTTPIPTKDIGTAIYNGLRRAGYDRSGLNGPFGRMDSDDKLFFSTTASRKNPAAITIDVHVQHVNGDESHPLARIFAESRDAQSKYVAQLDYALAFADAPCVDAFIKELLPKQ